MRIITGMHRSGTSLMGQLFYAAGFDMGATETFCPADRWNPKGYYEQIDVIRINKALLHGPLWKFVYFHMPTTETILKRGRKLSESIQQAAAKYQDVVVKDPRFSVTLPAWTEHGAVVNRLLFCLRDPIQVAQSLWKRNRAFVRLGLHLWYIHNKTLVDHLGDAPVWYVYYGNVTNQATSAAEMRGVFRFFDRDMPDDQLQTLVSQCVNRKLHNHTDNSYDYPDHIRELWDELRARHAAQTAS